MSAIKYEECLGYDLSRFVQVSSQMSAELIKLAGHVQNVYTAQLSFLKSVECDPKPNVMELFQATAARITDIQNFRDSNRKLPEFNHLSAVSEGIAAFAWVNVKPTPAPFIKDMIDASTFYTNKILVEFKNKDKRHSEWVDSWLGMLRALHAFVKEKHTTGLVIATRPQAMVGTSNRPAPPLPPPPPAPTPISFDANSCSLGGAENDRSALFAEINQGENITKNLKKVTPEMRSGAFRNNGTSPTKPHDSVDAAKCAAMSPISSSVKVPVAKTPVFAKDGKKWKIENFVDDNRIVVENTEMNNIIYVYNCVRSTIIVKGKVNSITLDSCKKTAVLFDSVVASVEFVNCQSTKMQVFEMVPTIMIDKTDGCQIYLNDASLNVEIISSKSTEMNVCLPLNDDYIEHPIPEQYKTTITSDKQLKTAIVEKKG